MSTNRTKIDWAYKQAARLMNDSVYAEQYDRIRKVAAALRRAERRGQKKKQDTLYAFPDTVAGLTLPEILKMKAEKEALHPPVVPMQQYSDFEGLTAATIRRCKQQLEAAEIKPNVDGNWTMRVLNPETQILTKRRHKRMR